MEYPAGRNAGNRIDRALRHRSFNIIKADPPDIPVFIEIKGDKTMPVPVNKGAENIPLGVIESVRNI